jgi:replicative DNA helicase
MMLDPDSLYRALPLVSDEDCSLDSNRKVLHVIRDLAETGKPVDVITVVDALIAKGQLQDVGGAAYVTSLSDKVTRDLARVTNIEHYAAVVRDKTRRRQARAAAAALLAATEDPTVATSECLDGMNEALLEIQSASGKTTARHVKDIMPNVVREIEMQSAQQGLVGLSTGVPSLDLATGGIRLGETWTVGALPGRGKTALGVQILLANCSNGIPGAVFSLEMAGTEIGKRFLAARSLISALQLRNPHSIRQERWQELVEAAGTVAQMPIYVDERPTLNIQELLASARLYVRRFGVKFIIVDYLRLVAASGRDLRERVSNAANALRELAKSEKIGVVMLSQLRRPDGGVNAKPTMLDLKESGDIEAHSHVVVLPYLPIGENDAPEKDKQFLIIAKNRNGRMGSLPVHFDERRLQFLDRTERISGGGL